MSSSQVIQVPTESTDSRTVPQVFYIPTKTGDEPSNNFGDSSDKNDPFLFYSDPDNRRELSFKPSISKKSPIPTNKRSKQVVERQTRISAEMDPLALMMQAMMEDDDLHEEFAELGDLLNDPSKEDYLFLASYDEQ